jgi:hypothetical protein
MTLPFRWSPLTASSSTVAARRVVRRQQVIADRVAYREAGIRDAPVSRSRGRVGSTSSPRTWCRGEYVGAREHTCVLLDHRFRGETRGFVEMSSGRGPLVLAVVGVVAPRIDRVDRLPRVRGDVRHVLLMERHVLARPQPSDVAADEMVPRIGERIRRRIDVAGDVLGQVGEIDRCPAGVETYLEALSAAIFAGHLATPGGTPLDVSLAAKAAPRPPDRRGPELLLEGLASLFSESYKDAVPILRLAHNAFDVDGLPVNEQLRWKWLAAVSSVLLWDDARWEAISERHVHIARETGALAELPLALTMRVYVHLFAGELATASSLVEEIRAATDATGSSVAPYGAVGLAAFRGRESDAAPVVTASRPDGAKASAC